MKIDAIFFDLDGTLWDSTDAVVKTWNMVIKNVKEINEVVTKEKIKSIMGLQLPEIAERMFPDVDKNLKIRILKKCCSSECDMIKKEGGELFPNLEETLEKLYKKYPLFIVSNCQEGYIEAFLEYHKLEKYFKDHKCAGETGLPKGENIKLMVKDYKFKNPVYVGDTFKDFEAAKLADIPFVYASYGFGKVPSYDYKIEKFEQLLNL